MTPPAIQTPAWRPRPTPCTLTACIALRTINMYEPSSSSDGVDTSIGAFHPLQHNSQAVERYLHLRPAVHLL